MPLKRALDGLATHAVDKTLAVFLYAPVHLYLGTGHHRDADERARTIPVIALTGVPEWLQNHRSSAAEFDGILLKPCPSPS